MVRPVDAERHGVQQRLLLLLLRLSVDVDVDVGTIGSATLLLVRELEALLALQRLRLRLRIRLRTPRLAICIRHTGRCPRRRPYYGYGHFLFRLLLVFLKVDNDKV